jgi:hypothetical protein
MPAASIIKVESLLFCPEDEKKQIPPKCWEQSTKLHDITSVTEVNFSHHKSRVHSVVLWFGWWVQMFHRDILSLPSG